MSLMHADDPLQIENDLLPIILAILWPEPHTEADRSQTGTTK